MPIGYSFTLEEEKLLKSIRTSKIFKSAIKQKTVSNDLLTQLKKYFTNVGYDNRFDLLAIAFEAPDPVDPIYVEEETEALYKSGKQRIRELTKNEFNEFVEGINENQYAYFRFHNSKEFLLGYIDKNCSQNCLFVSSKLDNGINEGSDSIKNKKGILHTKEELALFITQMIGDKVNLHRRKYKKAENPKKDHHTIIITDNIIISSSYRLENKGGSCCPPYQ